MTLRSHASAGRPRAKPLTDLTGKDYEWYDHRPRRAGLPSYIGVLTGTL
jgi:hypothetical protein